MSEQSRFEQDGDSVKVSNVMFLYTQFQKPAHSAKYNKTSWQVSFAMSREAAVIWHKAFPNQKVTAYDIQAFKDKFHVDADGDKLCVVQLSQDAKLKDGRDVEYSWTMRPKVYSPSPNGVEDITMTKLVGNGSMGIMAAKSITSMQGTNAKPEAILVEELIEYKKQSATPFGDAAPAQPATPFGQPSQAQPQQVSQEPPAHVTQPIPATDQPAGFDQFTDDIPF